MKKLEVYFDYACPYCYKGLQELSSLLKKYPDTKVEYIPCEAHPRPEPAAIHSDLAAQVGCYLQERGLDIAKYNDLVYHAHFVEKRRIDDPALLCEFASLCGADASDVSSSLKENVYANQVIANNKRVWETLAFDAVPSYRFGDKIAASGGGLLVDIHKVEELIK